MAMSPVTWAFCAERSAQKGAFLLAAVYEVWGSSFTAETVVVLILYSDI